MPVSNAWTTSTALAGATASKPLHTKLALALLTIPRSDEAGNVPDESVVMHDLAASVQNGVFGLLDEAVGQLVVLEPDDDILHLVDGQRAGHKGHGGDEERGGLHSGRAGVGLGGEGFAGR